MEKKFWFGIENLMYYKGKNKKMAGDPYAMLIAEKITAGTKEAFNRMAKVWFDDETIFQYKTGEGYTSHDTYMIGCRLSETRLQLTLWIVEECRLIPVARAYQSDRKICIMPDYETAVYHRKLTEEEIQQIFDYLFDNPNRLEINRIEK